MLSEPILDFNLNNYEKVVGKLLTQNLSETIYDGKAGAIIYLIELYELSGEKTILSKCEDIAHDILHCKTFKSGTNYSFYSGKMGVAYSFLLLLEKTKNKKYKKWLISIAKECSLVINNSKETIIDLINGVSGVLLGFLHIYNSGIKEQWLVDKIKYFVDFIISKAKIIENQGLFWDVNALNNVSLAGFSHGSSGIGFVFYELYRLTNNDVFKLICKMSLAYEDKYYSKSKKNWEDNRGPNFYTNRDHLDYLLKNDKIEAFVKKKFMRAWCHGSPGILMVREYIGLKPEDYNEILEGIIDSMETSNPKKKINHSLCHGVIGNALIILNLKDGVGEKNIKSIIEVYLKALNRYLSNNSLISGDENLNENKGLFTGDLGFFYYSLKLYRYIRNINLGRNIIMPFIQNVNKDKTLSNLFLNYNKSGLFLELMRNHYSETINFINNKKKILKNFSSEKSFFNAVKLIGDKGINDVLNFEKQIKNINENQRSLAFNYFRNLTDINFILKNKNLKKLEVKVNPRVNYVNTEYVSRNLKFLITPNPLTFVIIPTLSNKILVRNDFLSFLINYINKNNSISVEKIITYFSNSVEGFSEETLIETIKELIQLGLIEITY